MINFNEFDFKHVESQVDHQTGNYKGLTEEALYTSYEDFLSIMLDEEVKGRWLDLGGGDGRSALLYGELFPDREGYSLEFSRPRVEAGRKKCEDMGLTNVHLIEGDLSICPIPDADTYFLYFATGIVLDRILYELSSKEKDFKLVAIESHGDLFSRLKKENWLFVKKSVPLKFPRHNSHALIFEKTSSTKRSFSLHHVSFFKRYLLIQDKSGKEWLGESFGLEWERDDQYQLLNPPRTIHWGDVKFILHLNQIPTFYHKALSLRPLQDLTFITQNKIYKGIIRKIFVGPCFELEFSTGEQVEWMKITSIYWNEYLCYESSSDYFSLPLAPMESTSQGGKTAMFINQKKNIS